jgi:glucose-1-phosphate thymidylyltransferase
MWGVIPAAGKGSRMQPLAFSKELLPVGTRADGERERPVAVCEYLVERMVIGGAHRICFVISPGKSDILEYFGGRAYSADVCYTVQPEASGLCDAIFRAAPFIDPNEPVVVGLPDTIWYPEEALSYLPDDALSFLLFPVERPELFDAVLTGDNGEVIEIQVKRPDPGTKWVWGAFKIPGRTFLQLRDLWLEEDRKDEYIGTLVNAWLAKGGKAVGVHAGERYVDVGTVNGYREALRTLGVYA